MKADLVVIGGGLSGVMAALRAKSQGKSVAVIRKAWGGTALSTGAFDIGYTNGETHDVAIHTTRIKTQQPFHPYNYLNLDLLPNAVELLKESLKLELRGSTQENHLFLTQEGRWQHASLAMESHYLDFRNFKKSALLLGIRPMLPKPMLISDQISVATVDWPYDEHNLLPSMMAKKLDSLEDIRTFANHIKEGIDSHKFSVLLFPPILGLERFGEVRRELESHLGAPVYEALGSHPSVPGIRFQRGLDAALAKNHIKVVPGVVTRVDSSKQKIYSIDTSSGEKLEGKNFVLATGKFFSGGIRKDQTFRETVFNLPLAYQNEWVGDKHAGAYLKKEYDVEQPLFQIGVKVNRELQPINEHSEVVYENLRACGTVLAGFDPNRGRCRFGVSLVSGYTAGDMAS